MSAARLHANDRGVCGVFMPAKSGEFCRACGMTVHVHRRQPCSQCGGEFRPTRMINVSGFSACEEHRKGVTVAEEKLCSFCPKPTPATHKCQCSDAKCKVLACAGHRHLTQNPALIPSVGK